MSSKNFNDSNHLANINYRSSSEDPTEFLKSMGFTFGRSLGQGSYCKVRMATRGNMNYAVKIISRESQSKDFTDRFLPREIQILQRVNHPNIIKVYHIMDFVNQVYIFMEVIERGDMLDYIRERGRLTEREAHKYFSQLVSAVQYLHSRNICHRDLKCENIMITDTDEIKIIDFGFCKSCVDDVGKRKLSETYCGSTAYAAPEVLMGNPYNPMMYDVWSLGCVLFIMVAGSMPFDDSNVRQMLRAQLKKKVRFPGLSNLLSCDIQRLVKHMLEPDVTKRATIDQIAKDSWFVQFSMKTQRRSSITVEPLS